MREIKTVTVNVVINSETGEQIGAHLSLLDTRGIEYVFRLSYKQLNTLIAESEVVRREKLGEIEDEQDS